MERGLVAAKVHLYAFLGAVFPQVNHVALIGKRAGRLLGASLIYGGKQLVQIGVYLVNPSLRVAFLCGSRVDFGGDGDNACNVACLGLCAAHAAEAGGDEQFACRAAAKFAGSIQHCDGGAVHNALWAYVHVGTCRHLAVLCYAEGVVALPVVGFRVVGNHHTIGNHHARSVLMAGVESHGMAAVHHEGLLVGHLREVFHHEAVLCPVLKHCAVATIGDEFVGVLCHCGVQVVLNHQHDGGSLTTFGGIFLNGAGIHLVGGTQAVHINAAVLLQLLGKLLGQHLVILGGKIAQGVADGQFLLGRRQYVLTFWGVVDGGVVGLWFGQRVGNTETQFILKFFKCHGIVI